MLRYLDRFRSIAKRLDRQFGASRHSLLEPRHRSVRKDAEPSTEWFARGFSDMADQPAYTEAPPTAAHPLHTILAAYPIACFTGAFLTDIVYAETADMQWANFSAWLITVGVVMGVLAAIAGIAAYVVGGRGARTRRPAWPHTIGSAAVLILSVFNGLVHSRDAYTSVVPAGIILSGIVAVLVIATSWLGAPLLHKSADRHDVFRLMRGAHQ
jgi:uncharacterized membrane protein